MPVQYSTKGSGPALLYIPGMEGTGQLFYKQIPQLALHYTVITSVLRKETPFSYDDLTQDALRILDSISTEPAVVIGESFGGTVALHFALAYPARTRHLVLVNTFPYFRQRFRLWLALRLLRLGFSRPGNAVRKAIFRIQLRREGLDEEGIQKVLQCSFSQGIAASRQRLQLIRSHDVRNRLSEIQLPVSIVASEKDRVVPSPREAEFMASRMPNAKIHRLPDQGHLCLVQGNFLLARCLESETMTRIG